MNKKLQFLNESDENLLYLFANRKEKMAIEVLFDRYMACSYFLAYKYMHNQADAEDVVQKAFINIMKYAGDQNKPGVVKAWIMKTVINTSLNELKHISRHRKRVQSQLPPQEAKCPEDLTDAEELSGKLIKAIDQLPEHFKIPIWLTHYENMTIKEVSNCLGKPEKTIRAQISRGIDKLRDILKISGSQINASNIIAILAFCKSNDKAPLSLYEKINKLSSMKLSGKITILPIAQNITMKYLYFSFASIFVFCFLWFGWYQYKNGLINSSTNIEKIHSTSRDTEINSLNLFCDFSSGELPSWLTFELGEAKILREKQIDNFLKVERPQNFSLKLNIPHQKSPYKISYDIRIVGALNSKPQFYAPAKNNLDTVTFLFDNSFWENSWTHVDLIIQDNIESMWINNTPRIVYAYKDLYNESIALRFSDAIISIDNVQVRSLNEKDKIDFSKCIQLAKDYREIAGPNQINIASPMPKYNKGNVKAYWGHPK